MRSIEAIDNDNSFLREVVSNGMVFVLEDTPEYDIAMDLQKLGLVSVAFYSFAVKDSVTVGKYCVVPPEHRD